MAHDDRSSARRDETLRERVTDDIVQAAARAAFDGLDPGDPRTASFFAWYARELRARRTPAERARDRVAAAAFGRQAASRWAEQSLGVRAACGRPALQETPASSVGRAVDLAQPLRRAPYVDLAVAAGVGRELWDEECTEWASIPDDVPAGRHVALKVAGDSMTPFLHGGDTVLVKLGDAIAGGSVVVARRPDDGYVVKRVGRVAGGEVELLSLNPDYPPISIPRDGRLVLGTVVLRWCDHR